ncbi:MAG: M48 family metalloprotease [Lysobacteraceae bacterium]
MHSAIRILSLSILIALTGTAIAVKKHAPARPAAAAVPTGTTQATVYKDNVAVHQAASATSPTVTSLNKGGAVEVRQQQGLWFNIDAQPNTVGFVRINEIRLAQPATGKGDGYSMFTGGHAKVSETAGVRGLTETDLRTAAMDEAALKQMESERVDAAAATAYASRSHLQRTELAYKDEPGVGKGHRLASVQSPEQQQAQQQESHAVKAGVFSMIGSRIGLGGVSSDSAADALPKSEQEKVDEETYMGPQVAGRMLGALPLWNDAQAQRRVNTIGRWVAMQTPRDDLPWTFAILDTNEINAFAAPGGYVFMTRGLYEVLQSDDEVAAVLGHEINHVVARDHYNVIHKQALASVAGGALWNRFGAHAAGNALTQQLTDYFAKQGATIFLTTFDKSVEYRSDAASQIYIARAGYNPMAMYAVLQKLAAVSGSSGRLADLYKTHPSATDRLDALDKNGFADIAQYADRPYVIGMR